MIGGQAGKDPASLCRLKGMHGVPTPTNTFVFFKEIPPTVAWSPVVILACAPIHIPVRRRGTGGIMKAVARIKLMLFFISAVAVAVAVAAAGAEKDGKIYLVHMDKSQKPAVFFSHEQWYQSIERM